ncbi:hypothetical protein BJ684DRAFT_17634, partial [Piptocephalis cylindrospora]
CRDLWYGRLKGVCQHQGFKPTFSTSDAQHLILGIYDQGCDLEKDIRWSEVMPKTATQWGYTQLIQHWYRLRNSVPDWRAKSLDEILESLIKEYEEKTNEEGEEGESPAFEAAVMASL